jgi:hypothetical protein
MEIAPASTTVAFAVLVLQRGGQSVVLIVKVKIDGVVFLISGKEHPRLTPQQQARSTVRATAHNINNRDMH